MIEHSRLIKCIITTKKCTNQSIGSRGKERKKRRKENLVPAVLDWRKEDCLSFDDNSDVLLQIIRSR
jgi:hypothetical protein